MAIDRVILPARVEAEMEPQQADTGISMESIHLHPVPG
jgi:hypothetical protein